MATENPYSPPSANLEEQFETGAAGGTLEGGIAGNYDFSIGDVIKEAWSRTKGLKGSFWGAAIIVFLIVMVLSFVLGLIVGMLGLGGDSGAGIVAQLVVQLGITAAIYPFMAGIMMMGVNRSVDLPVTFDQAFGYFAYAVPVVIAGLLITLLTWLGFLLLIIPGIYLSIAYMLTVVLVVEKKLGAWEAMEASRKAITHHWFKIFFLFIAMGLIVLVSMIPLGIGLIWTYPMMVAAMGIVYRDVFGVEAARAA